MDTMYYSRVAYARTIAENSGLSLKEEDICIQPRTTRGFIYVPKYDPMWNEDSPEAISWWGKFLHEIYHNDTRYENNKIFDILEKNKDKMTKMLAMCNNMVEDARIESTEYGEYPGRDRIMDALRNTMYKQYVININEGKSTGSRKVDALFWLQWACFNEWMDSLPCIDTYDLEHPETKEYIDKIRKYIPRIRALKSSKESWDISREICEELVDDSPSIKEKWLKVKAEIAKEGEEGEGEEVEVGKYLLDDHEMRESKAKERKDDAPPGKGFVKGKGVHIPPPFVEKNPDDLPSHAFGYSYLNSIPPLVSVDGLAAQIKRYLLVKVRSKTVNNQKTGRVDAASLWKSVVYNTSSVGKKVFQKDDEHMNLDTAVSLVVDTSGSMHGSKYSHAAASAVILNEVFSKIGVKTRITGFTDSTTETWNYVHKDFGEKLTKDKLIARLARAGDHVMNGNADGENILWEYGKLVQRQEPKKIMIVLSDGYPSTGKHDGGDIWEFTNQVVKSIEKEGLVQIIGIGIMDDSVSNFYKKYKILNNATDIESTLLDILKRNVLHA